jgi:hypothetical protein
MKSGKKKRGKCKGKGENTTKGKLLKLQRNEKYKEKRKCHGRVHNTVSS